MDITQLVIALSNGLTAIVAFLIDAVLFGLGNGLSTLLSNFLGGLVLPV